jgi:hypothetical protein
MNLFHAHHRGPFVFRPLRCHRPHQGRSVGGFAMLGLFTGIIGLVWVACARTGAEIEAGHRRGTVGGATVRESNGRGLVTPRAAPAFVESFVPEAEARTYATTWGLCDYRSRQSA